MDILVAIIMILGIMYFILYRLLIRMSWKQHQAGHHNRAMRLVNLAIHFYPRPVQALINRSAFNGNYFRNYQSMIEDCTRAIRFDGQAAMAYNNRGYAYQHLGCVDESINDYDKAIALKPDLLHPHMNRAQILYDQMHEYEAARAVSTIGLRRFPQCFPFYQTIVACHIQMNDFDAALGVCRDAASQGLNAAYVQCLHALILEKQQGLNEAQQVIDKAIERAPADPIVLSIVAGIYVRAGEFKQALDIRTSEIVVKPTSDALYVARGYLYNRLGQHDKALRDYHDAIELNPYAAVVYNNRASTFNSQGKYDAALRDVNRCIELEPAFKNGYGTRGEIYFAMGDYEAALADFEKAEALKMNDGFALIGQAITQYKLGHADDAKSCWRQVIDHEPEFADIDTIINKFDPPISFISTVKEVAILT